MVIAFVLPECRVPAQDAIRLVRSEPFERAEPLFSHHMRRHEQMHVIRHYHECMQFVTVKTILTVSDGIDHELRAFRLPQEHRTASGLVRRSSAAKAWPEEKRAGGKVRLVGRLPARRKVTNMGQPTASQMRQTAFVSVHQK